MSWGSPNKDEKFYKGAKNDTAWNKDLLWRYHVAKETKQSKINTGEIPCPDPAVKMRHIRMRMGITGTLIPDVTPRYEETSPLEPRSLHTSHTKRSIGREEEYDVRSVVSKRYVRWNLTKDASCVNGVLRAVPSSRSLKSSGLTATPSVASSSRTLRVQDIQQIVESQSRLLKENMQEEILAMRLALQEEARKREAAERKLTLLCEKLGIDGE